MVGYFVRKGKYIYFLILSKVISSQNVDIVSIPLPFTNL